MMNLKHLFAFLFLSLIVGCQSAQGRVDTTSKNVADARALIELISKQRAELAKVARTDSNGDELDRVTFEVTRDGHEAQGLLEADGQANRDALANASRAERRQRGQATATVSLGDLFGSSPEKQRRSRYDVLMDRYWGRQTLLRQWQKDGAAVAGGKP